jgi:hypothetical protein
MIGFVTLKLTEVLVTPLTVTVTPNVPPGMGVGTVVEIDVLVQLEVEATVLPNFTVPDEPKLVPVMVTGVPDTPDVEDRLVMFGAANNEVPVRTSTVNMPTMVVRRISVSPQILLNEQARFKFLQMARLPADGRDTSKEGKRITRDVC